MQEVKESITLKIYALQKTSVAMIQSVPRSMRFTYGDRLYHALADLLEVSIRAYYVSASEKLPLLADLNIRLEILRFYYRFGYESGFFGSTKYGEFAAAVDEIGRMTGGWIKSLQRK